MIRLYYVSGSPFSWRDLATAFRAVARERFFTPPEQRDRAALASAQRDVRHELERLEERAARRRGEFILGATPTRADFTWLPFVEIAARADVDLDPARTPWLVAGARACGRGRATIGATLRSGGGSLRD